MTTASALCDVPFSSPRYVVGGDLRNGSLALSSLVGFSVDRMKHGVML